MKEQGIRIDRHRLSTNNPDRFALQRIFRELKEYGVGNEYFVGGEWTKGPLSEKPERTRVVFADINRFRIAKETYFVWKTIVESSVYDTEGKEKIIRRLIEPQLNALAGFYFGGAYGFDLKPSLTLFVPWGVRPEGKYERSEAAVLDRIKDFRDMLRNRNILTNILLMPADLYATEVNRQVRRKRSNEYFDKVTEEAQGRGFIVKPWSQIRDKNSTTYEQRSLELTSEALHELLPPQVVTEALSAAKRRSGFWLQADIEDAAFRYLRERICEAEIVETVYAPIKLSAVSKQKDNFVDRDLPRVYIVPNDLQFPWLK